ncbi:MAG: hypothetical protein KC550_06345, partial [Nanoarchaeota archaeon]|nr:hypothetical protein [Nanoarchaeota archaeon]
VLIGLCINGIPTLGVVYVPARNILYYAEKGKGSFMEFENKISKLNVNNISKINQSKIVTRQNRGEKRDMDQLVDSLLTIEQILESSGGVKLGLITEKKAEIHINTHFGVSKWDTCAPQIILEEAGGKITDFEGKELDYKQKSLNWEKSYVATNSIIHDEVIEHIKDYLNNN